MPIELKGASTTVTVDGCNFILRPQLWTDRAEAIEQIEQTGYTSERVLKSTMMYLITLKCIESWDGVVDSDGNPLECNEDTKMMLYSQKPTVLDQIMEKFFNIKLRAEGNSESTQDG